MAKGTTPPPIAPMVKEECCVWYIMEYQFQKDFDITFYHTRLFTIVFSILLGRKGKGRAVEGDGGGGDSHREKERTSSKTGNFFAVKSQH